MKIPVKKRRGVLFAIDSFWLLVIFGRHFYLGIFIPMGFLNICLRQPGSHVIGGFLRWSHKYYGAAPSAPWKNGLAFEFISIIAYTAGVARVNGPHDQTENRGKRVKARLPLRTILSSCHSFLHFPNLIGQLVPSVLISFLRG